MYTTEPFLSNVISMHFEIETNFVAFLYYENYKKIRNFIF